MNKEINPILPEGFLEKLRIERSPDMIDYRAYFEPYIVQTINYAVGPYCWFIPDSTVMKIVAVSDNIRQLTPYTQEEWIGQDPAFLAANVHPDDASYFLAAITIAAEIHENNESEKRENIRTNIYCRMLDGSSNYRWTLIQFVARYYNAAGRIESTLGLMTDLSALNMVNVPMMTVIDNNNKEHQYFKVMIADSSFVPISLPKITRREQEIMQLIIKGLNTPQIATVLNISYHTVENHKKNLRNKTETKTTAELVYFIKSNFMI